MGEAGEEPERSGESARMNTPLAGRRLEPTQAPDLGDRLRRAVWGIAWATLYRPSPVVAHGWRRSLLRIFGARVGAGAHPYPSARVWAPWNLEMGPRSCLGPGAICYSAAPIVLEADSVVSQRVHLCAASHDFRHPEFPLVTAPIIIGQEAWVAAEAFIGPGVRVGKRAVVGARAVVTRDILDGSIVAGNPAKTVGMRRMGPAASATSVGTS